MDDLKFTTAGDYMMNQWHHDINEMHAKYGVHDWIEDNMDNKELMQKFLDFRLKFLEEELNETKAAAQYDRNASEVVDGLIDLCVIHRPPTRLPRRQTRRQNPRRRTAPLEQKT